MYGELPVFTRQPVHCRGTVHREGVGCSCRLPAYAQTRERSTAWQHEASTPHQTVAAAAASTSKQGIPSEATAADLPTASAAMPFSHQWATTTTLTAFSSRLHMEVGAAKAVPIAPRLPLRLRISVWRGSGGGDIWGGRCARDEVGGQEVGEGCGALAALRSKSVV